MPKGKERRDEDADEAKTDEDADAEEASASDTDGGDASDEDGDADGEAESGDDDGQESEEEEPLEPKELPNRSTRGRRMAQALDAEEDEADNSFWAQDFFAEEQKDDSYEESSEDEDVPDSDFDKDVSSDSEEEGEEKVKKVKRTGGKKDQLPGYKQAAQRLARRAAKVRAQKERLAEQGKRKPAQDSETPEAEPAGVVPKEAKRARFAAPEEPAEPPSLRKSTLKRVKDDESRRRLEDRKPVARKKNGKAASATSHLKLGFVIDEAVTTEFLNQQSLQRLLAQEEEVKAKANIVRRQAHGPRIRWRSARDDGAVSNTVQLVEMLEVPLDQLPAGLKRHYERPVRGDDFVVSGGMHVPRTRRLVNDGLATSGPALQERRLYLMSGEDVTDVRKFGPLYNLPWGGSIVHQVVYE